MNIKKWLTRAPKYAPQVLDPKVKEILDQLDSQLTSKSTTIPADGILEVSTIKIGLFSQHFPVDRIVKEMLSKFNGDVAYIPRSIAFLCDQDGNWCFYVGQRKSNIEVNEVACELFSDALLRTNNARI